MVSTYTPTPFLVFGPPLPHPKPNRLVLLCDEYATIPELSQTGVGILNK